MSVEGIGATAPSGTSELANAKRTGSSAPGALLTESEVKDLIERINANQEYQLVLKDAQKALDKALARNMELQVRFLLNCPACLLNNFFIRFLNAS